MGCAEALLNLKTKIMIFWGRHKYPDYSMIVKKATPEGCFFCYFSRMKTLMGVPVKFQCSRILFSR